MRYILILPDEELSKRLPNKQVRPGRVSGGKATSRSGRRVHNKEAFAPRACSFTLAGQKGLWHSRTALVCDLFLDEEEEAAAAATKIRYRGWRGAAAAGWQASNNKQAVYYCSSSPRNKICGRHDIIFDEGFQ